MRERLMRIRGLVYRAQSAVVLDTPVRRGARRHGGRFNRRGHTRALLVLWRGGTDLPNLVTLVDDEGRLSRGSAH